MSIDGSIDGSESEKEEKVTKREEEGFFLFSFFLFLRK